MMTQTKTNTVRLVEPTTDLAFEFLTMAYESQRAGDDRFGRATENFAAYMEMLADYAEGVNLPEGYVQTETFWLVRDDNVILGTSRLRMRLTSALECGGGNIGYDIRPGQRGKGYGKAILELTLDKARQLGLARALVTCHPDNPSSVAVIRNNDGVFADAVVCSNSGKTLLRYWIDLTETRSVRR